MFPVSARLTQSYGSKPLAVRGTDRGGEWNQALLHQKPRDFISAAEVLPESQTRTIRVQLNAVEADLTLLTWP